jgi:hypothetical protein
MPNYQNSAVDADKLIIGNCKVEAALSAGTTFSNLGGGIVTTWAHPVEKFEVQAGNAPDPIAGIASETCTVEFELIEFDASVLNVIHGGLVSVSTTSSVVTVQAGGQLDNTIAERAFRFTNSREIGGNTVATILTVFYATMDAGPSFNWKSDNDADPLMVMPCAITGKIETSRDAGAQLYTLTHDLP